MQNNIETQAEINQTKLEITPLTQEQIKCDCKEGDCIPMCNNGRICCINNIFVEDLMF